MEAHAGAPPIRRRSQLHPSPLPSQLQVSRLRQRGSPSLSHEIVLES
ncbi:uncharacterized protein J3R85_010638 [Psidium guajava]|nr:uncharacterized protein J3R85_010638 [Psidium guajava]